MLWDVVVVGGGPAGLFASVSAAEMGARTVLLERMGSPGRKLLVSGGGQCNLTHGGEIGAFLGHYGGGDRPGVAGRFLRPALYAFSNTDLAAYCARRGVPLAEAPDGHVFPASRRVQD
ncbi:TPA: NAD(P)/FAD-dependent oxidoreductase, partial [Candidatus Acetothermia bacterium]|nr:NAD(P)/FAD-dependent oxidoreductase [Candidatus Acetothermia bacterium]